MNNTANNRSAFPKFICSIFGHQYQVSKKVTYFVKEYKCSCCGKELTTNGKGNLVELTPKHKEINSILARIHDKKRSKLGKEILTTKYKLSS